MTNPVNQYVKELGLKGKTLDIGALDVNGCVREFFDDYTGLDMRDGPNVDMVANAHHLDFNDATFDNVLCLDTLEHDDRFWVSISEMKRVLKPGGRLVITVPGIAYPEHEYPNDYWRFTGEALKSLLSDMDNVDVDGCNGYRRAVFGNAVKR